MTTAQTRIDQIVGGIYRISTGIRQAITQVLDPARLANVVLLHWEGDENGGMTRFMHDAPQSDLIGSLLSIS